MENDRRPTALMTAFRPGQSPPPVSTLIRTGRYDRGCRRWESNPHSPRGTDFESGASTNSANSARRHGTPYSGPAQGPRVNAVLNRRSDLHRTGQAADTALCTRVHPICRRRRSIEKAQFACALRALLVASLPLWRRDAAATTGDGGGGGGELRRCLRLHARASSTGRGRSGLSVCSDFRFRARAARRRLRSSARSGTARQVGLEGRRPQDRLPVV